MVLVDCPLVFLFLVVVENQRHWNRVFREGPDDVFMVNDE
jgi:hypothetical protein